MGATKNMDCPGCHKWLGECDCPQMYNEPDLPCGIIFNEGDKIDAIMREMTEPQLAAMQAEGAEHWVCSWPPQEDNELPF